MEDSERRKVTELLKEMRSNTDEIKASTEEGALKWMYKGPTDLIDREEYLLGKAIDKTFEELNNTSNSNLVGRTAEQSNVPKRLLERTDNTEQVDIAKKILEDPLYAIKQKEMEARKKLLNNPVKLKQIKEMLLQRRNKNNSHKKQKKENKKKKIEEQLNHEIIKILKKFSDKEKQKALNKILKQESDSSSSISEDDKKKYKSKRKKSSSSGSTSSSESSNSEDNRKNKKMKKRKKKEVQNKKKKKSSSSLDSSDDSDSSSSYESEIEQRHSRKHKSSKTNNSESESSDSGKDRKRKDSENKRNIRERDDRGKRKAERREDSDDRKRKKNYGLMMMDGTKPDMKRRSPVRKCEKKVEAKPKYVPPPPSKPLSEKEREEKLKEMMLDAKHRKEDREKNLASHRKKELQEEKNKIYDEDFMRRQMKHLTSQGTMADRIKSNINNIQRSKSSMNSNFMRK